MQIEPKPNRIGVIFIRVVAGAVTTAITSVQFCAFAATGFPRQASYPTPHQASEPKTQQAIYLNGELPFWIAKPELQKRMREDREIVVAVRREDLATPKGMIRFTIQGAGVVTRDMKTCFSLAQQYTRLKEVSDHFKTVTWDADKSQLFLVTEALGYQARMIFKIGMAPGTEQSRLDFEIVWGHFKGMLGQLSYAVVDKTHTEVSFQARFEAKELPLPKILMGFALEVIAKRVGENMRQFFESQPAVSAK